MDEPRFVLKTTPPRAHRMAIARPRLDALWSDIQERTLIEICAPRGFGKSTLLVQWRRRWLERGALVAWVTLDAQDDPAQFAGAIAFALRVASGRNAFDHVARGVATEPERALDALTAVLSEVANLATPTVLMLDDGEQLPEATAQSALSYLLFNAPANLQIVIGTRQPIPVPTIELSADGNFARVSIDELRFELDESVALLGKRFGKRLELDDCVRLHERTEGWPIGLQLAAAAIERSPHYHTAIMSLSARQGDIERYFIESLVDGLPAPVGEFLTKIAILDPMSVELCEATTGSATSALWLDQIMTDTPIVTVAELRGWMRLHSLARDFLMARFERLPAAERNELHRRAASWLAVHEHLPEATRHALAMGDDALAEKYIEQSVWQLATAGNLSEAQQWLGRLPPAKLAEDVPLRLTRAWILAFSDRAEESRQIAGEVLSDPAASEEIAFHAALVGSCAEGCLDRVGSIPATLARWPEVPDEVSEPVHRLAYFNTRALVAFHDGDFKRARSTDLQGPTTTPNSSLQLALAIARLIAGVSHLREGDPQSAEALLQPALTHADRTLGRRSTVATIHAVGVAASLYERGEIARAESTLAHRLDVVERFFMPDPVLIAYETIARLALAQDDERRAIVALENLQVLGRDRRMPRLTLVSQALRIELHAKRGRTETAQALLAELEAQAPVFEYPEYQPFLAEYRMRRAISRAYVALASFDPASADAELAVAADVAKAAHRRRDALTILVLRAVAARRQRSPHAGSLLAEALGLASLRGCLRVAEDAHPEAVAMRDEAAAMDGTKAASAKNVVHALVRTATQKAAATSGGLLTPKEAEVLSLLASGQSNKHIAKTMNISDETVKWHLKNLFSKLSAGTRRHAVDRARMMGLVVDATAA